MADNKTAIALGALGLLWFMTRDKNGNGNGNSDTTTTPAGVPCVPPQRIPTGFSPAAGCKQRTILPIGYRPNPFSPGAAGAGFSGWSIPEEWYPGMLGTVSETVEEETETGDATMTGSGGFGNVRGCDPPQMFRAGDTPEEGGLFFPHIPFAPPPWGIPTPGFPIPNLGWSVPALGAPAPTGTMTIVGEGEVAGGASGATSGLNMAHGFSLNIA